MAEMMDGLGFESGAHNNDVFYARISKIILTIAFFILTLTTIQLAFTTPNGYVVDIYSELPNLFIFSIIVTFSIASLFLFNRIRHFRRMGILLLILLFVIVLILPYVLGYYSMGRADDMSYIGEYLSISNEGRISGWDIYPASPIIGALLVVISGLQPNIISFIIPILFSCIFVYGAILFSNNFSKNYIYKNIIISSSFILYLGMYNFLNTPHALFFAFLPIYLFVLFKYVQLGTFSFAIIVVLLSILIPFTHPFIVFFVVIFQVSLLLLKPIIKNLISGDIDRIKNIAVIQMAAFAAWFLYSSTLLGSFSRSVNAFLLNLTEPVLAETTEKIASVGLEPLSFAKFLFFYYGRYLIPTILILLFLLIYYKHIKNNIELNRQIKFLFIVYLVTIAIEAVLFLNPLISHQPDRMTNLLFLVIFQIPALALLSMIYINKNNNSQYRSTIRVITVVFVVVFLFSSSLLGALPSPMVYHTNSALTNNEVAGMKWVFNFREGNNMASPLSQVSRFHTLFNDGMGDNRVSIPYHFGYDGINNSLSDSVTDYSGSLYLVVLQTDVVLYEEIPGYSDVGRYKYNDYYHLNCDDSVINIYTGLNIFIYHTSSG